MIPSLGFQRPLISQQFQAFTVAVTNVAPGVPLSPIVTREKLVTTFVISNPSTSGGSVFLGNPGVTPATGLEIPVGTMPAFQIDQGGRQLYELQFPLEQIRAGLACNTPQTDGLPFVVWDLQNVFLVAAVAGPINVSAAIFFTMYF